MLIVLNVVFLAGTYVQVVLGQSFGNRPAGDTILIIVTAGMILLTVSMALFRLDTRVKTDGIDVRFYPFRRRYRHYTWGEIKEAYIRRYRPLAEYGGWGIRIGFHGNGQALNMSGNVGLQLVFANNKKLMIGTNRSQELEDVLKQLGKLRAQ